MTPEAAPWRRAGDACLADERVDPASRARSEPVVADCDAVIARLAHDD